MFVKNLAKSAPLQDAKPKLQNCPFCLAELDPQGSHLAPMTLSVCGHTYCTGCISILMRKDKAGASVVCPTCRVYSPVPQQVLESNSEVVLEMLTTMAKRKKMQQQKQRQQQKQQTTTKESPQGEKEINPPQQRQQPPPRPARSAPSSSSGKSSVSFILRKAAAEAASKAAAKKMVIEGESNDKEEVIRPDSQLEEKMRLCLAELETLVTEWIVGTKELIADVEALKDEMRKHHKNARIARVSGHTTCVAGGVLCVAGAATAFFTFGTSLALTVAGTALAAAGNCTASGAVLVEWRLLEKLGKKADELFKEQAKRTSGIATKLHEAECILEEVMLKRNDKMTKGEKVDLSIEAGTIVWNVGSMATTLVSAGYDVASGISATLMTGASTLSIGLTVGGGVVTALFIPVDVAFAGWNAYKLHTGSLPKKAKELKGLAALLEVSAAQVEEAFAKRDFQALHELFPLKAYTIEESPASDQQQLLQQQQPALGEVSKKVEKKERKKKEKEEKKRLKAEKTHQKEAKKVVHTRQRAGTE